MSAFTPEWAISVNGAGNVTNLVLSDVTITSGRTDIYSQPIAGYANFTIKNFNEDQIAFDVNDSVSIKIKNSLGVFVPIFGGDVTDINLVVTNGDNGFGIVQDVNITALGALAKLPKTLTEGVLSKDYDGDQIYSILSGLLFNTWSETPAALTWAAYEPTTTWANAENTGLGEIDRPGDFELAARSSSTTDVYSLIANLATSGLGIIHEDSSGRIAYDDSTHRGEYLATNGYTYINADWAYAKGLQTYKRLGDIRNDVTITYKNNDEVNANDPASIATYGYQAQNIITSIENAADAEAQAEFYLSLRAYPQYQFKSISFPITNPNIPDASRDGALGIFMGLPVDIENLPANISDGRFQGFIEGWTWRSRFNALDLTISVSPIAYSLQAFKWLNVPVGEKWNTINPLLDWTNATIVA
jgi:hypothetical protein